MVNPKQQRIDPKTVHTSQAQAAKAAQAKSQSGKPAKSPSAKAGSAQVVKAQSAKASAKTNAKKTRSGRPGGRPPGVAPVKKATVGDWIAGARPQTLALSVAPVVLGTATAYVLGHEDAGPGWHWVRAALCLVVAIALQVGVNFANDYSDGVRGTDKHRVGPRRLTASGAARPRTVLTVALVFFGIAALAGAIIIVRTGYWWLFAVGAACILAAWFYTGGKRPYGYYGLGEAFVFVFFGIVATAGTTYVLAGTVTLESWLAGAAAGSFACAVLMVNNIRDIAQDRLAGKRTLAVLIGDRASRIVFSVLVVIPFGILVFFGLFYDNAFYTYFTALAAIPAIVITLTAKTAPELVLALRLTALTSLAYALLLGWAIAF